MLLIEILIHFLDFQTCRKKEKPFHFPLFWTKAAIFFTLVHVRQVSLVVVRNRSFYASALWWKSGPIYCYAKSKNATYLLKYLSTSWIYTPVGKSKTLSFCSDLDQSSHIFYIGTCHVSLVVAKNEILTCSCFVVEIWANVLDRIGSNWIELDQIGSN